MNGRLVDRVVIVTGSGLGIGKAIAIAMAQEGARVVTNNRKQGTAGGDAEATAKQIIGMGGQAVPFFGDISDFEVARKLIKMATESFGRLDILVNNAGIATRNTIWNMTEEEWDQVIASCLKGSFNCIRHACGLMIQQKWGRIINTTSLAWLGTMERSNYGAAKAGVVGLTRSVAMETGVYGVTCNAYAPWVATRLSAGAEHAALYKMRYELGYYNKEQYEAMMNPPGPETVIPLIIYLCTEQAASVNGQVFAVRGRKIAICTESLEKSIFKEQGFWTVDELIDSVPTTLLETSETSHRPDKQ